MRNFLSTNREGQNSSFVPIRFVYASVSNRYATATFEDYLIKELENNLGKIQQKFLRNVFQARFLIILGEDIETKEPQYLICKKIATTPAKDNCIRQMKSKYNYGEASEISCSFITDKFEDLCLGKVIHIFYEELKKIYADDSHPKPDDPVENNVKSSTVEDISFVNEPKRENVEESSKSIGKSAGEFLQLASKLKVLKEKTFVSEETTFCETKGFLDENTLCQTKVKKAKKFNCCMTK